MALLGLEFFLEVDKENAFDEVLIDLHLCVLVLREHLKEDFRLDLYLYHLLGLMGHWREVDGISRQDSDAEKGTQAFVLKEAALAIKVLEPLNVHHKVQDF
jgi:hypothetical protein